MLGVSALVNVQDYNFTDKLTVKVSKCVGVYGHPFQCVAKLYNIFPNV
jgi:hypothetical protein